MFDVLQYSSIQHALMTGSLIAIVTAITGYFLIVRGLTFAGHALPNIGFAGAAGAVMLGLNPFTGLLVFTVGAGIAIGLLGKQVRDRDIAIGIIMATALGLGILFLSLYSGYAEQAYSILFGQILGISQTDVLVTAMFSALTVGTLLVLFRPLLFSSYDSEVAQARGVPVRLLGVVFLVLVAVTISLSVQVIGALLVFTLLVGPAATAMRIVQRPFWAIIIAMGLGLLYTWVGILLAASGDGTLRVSFCIASLSFLVYLPVRLLSPLWLERRTRRESVGRQQRTFVLPKGFAETSNSHIQSTEKIEGTIR